MVISQVKLGLNEGWFTVSVKCELPVSLFEMIRSYRNAIIRYSNLII